MMKLRTLIVFLTNLYKITQNKFSLYIFCYHMIFDAERSVRVIIWVEKSGTKNWPQNLSLDMLIKKCDVLGKNRIGSC